MSEDLYINPIVVIPSHELEFTASRSGGPGGQHVNKSSTRISLRWNIEKTQALSGEQKERVISKLKSKITADGDIIVHNSSSRSQLHNKKMAMHELARLINKALHVSKKRKKTSISKSAQEARLKEKKVRSEVKKLRGKVYD